MAIAQNTAKDLGEYTCIGPEGEHSHLCRGITDYSGMVYNKHNHTIMMFGGGHATTFRDDVDVFHFDSLAWIPDYTPTPCSEMIESNLDSENGYWITSGHPYSRHTYDLLIVPPGKNELLILHPGGVNSYSSCESGPQYYPYGKAAHYDLAAKTWSWGAAMSGTWTNLSAAEVDPISGKWCVHFPLQRR